VTPDRICGTLLRSGFKLKELAPPTEKGKRGNAAKKAGEGAIIADLARVMVAAARRKGVKLADPADIHKRLRDPRTGRINPRNLKQPYPVEGS